MDTLCLAQPTLIGLEALPSLGTRGGRASKAAFPGKAWKRDNKIESDPNGKQQTW
jgi:hypothetical protein